MDCVNVLVIHCTVCWTNVCVLSVQCMVGWTVWLYCNNALAWTLKVNCTVWDLRFWQQFFGLWRVILGMSSSDCFEESQFLYLQGLHSERNSVSVSAVVHMLLNHRITEHIEIVLCNMICRMAHGNFLCYAVWPCRKCSFWAEATVASDQSPYQSLTQWPEVRRGHSVAGRPSRPSLHSWVCCSTDIQGCEMCFELK
jgi:hypothetical protein